jgi:leucyl-tRNA synthetase
VTLVIQVDGKTRDSIRVPLGINQEQAVREAMARESVRRHLSDGRVTRVVFVPNRLINLVTDWKTRTS